MEKDWISQDEFMQPYTTIMATTIATTIATIYGKQGGLSHEKVYDYCGWHHL